MSISVTERRQIENEMIFRRTNEKVSDELKALSAMDHQDERGRPVDTSDLLLRFKCECADENCDVRVPMKLSKYQDIHANRNAFIVAPGHQYNPIEKVMKQKDDYTIVEKFHTVSEPDGTLNSTAVDNV